MHQAAALYESEVPGLGIEFLDEIERTSRSIVAHPRSGTGLSPNIRRRILNRFPYGLLYAADEDEVVVVAVMHLHRQPDYWKDRFSPL